MSTEPTPAEIEAGRTDVDTLPPTQYLILEVLAARFRLGESFWTFPTRLGGAVKALESVGLVRSRSAPTPGAIQVSLTEAGRAAALCEGYRSPHVLDHDAPAAVVRIVAEHWRDAAVHHGWTTAGHALAMVLGALAGEIDPAQLGIPDDHPDAARITCAHSTHSIGEDPT